LLPVARGSLLVAAAELATSLKQSSPKYATNTEPLKRALTGCKATAPAHAPYLRPVGNTNHPATLHFMVLAVMGIYLNKTL